MDEVSVILMANQLMGKLVSPAEADELIDLARTAKLGSVPYSQSLLSMAQSIEKGGAEQKDKLLEIARTERSERDAQLQLIGWIRETLPSLVNDVALKGREEGDAKREFRERLQDFLWGMYPNATHGTIALTIGQCFEDLPGQWKFNVGRCVLALRNLKRI